MKKTTKTVKNNTIAGTIGAVKSKATIAGTIGAVK